jgi:hypothetical protein
MANIKNNDKIQLNKFLGVGLIALFLLTFLPPISSSSSYTGPTNPCYFWCDINTDVGPTINRVNSSTSHGFPFEALLTKHKTTIDGQVTFTSSKLVDWHNLAFDVGFVIVSDFVISSFVYLIYSSIYKRRRSTVSK